MDAGGKQHQPLALARVRYNIEQFFGNEEDGNAARTLQTSIRECADRLRDPFLVDPVQGGPTDKLGDTDDPHQKSVLTLVSARFDGAIPTRVLRPYARFASDYRNTKVLRPYQELSPELLPLHLSPGQKKRKADGTFVLDQDGKQMRDAEGQAELASRLWLFDRDQCLRSLELLFQARSSSDAVLDVVDIVDAALLSHLRTGNEDANVVGAGGGGAGGGGGGAPSTDRRKTLPVCLMQGLAKLTSEIDLFRDRARAGNGGNNNNDNSSTSSVPPSHAAFQTACAVAHRAHIARLLFLIYSTRQISVHALGNYYLPGYSGCIIEERCKQIRGGAPDHEDANVGGELLLLIDTIQRTSDKLWESPEHGDANPLFHVNYMLCFALFQAIDFMKPKRDPDLLAAGYYNKYLAAAVGACDDKSNPQLLYMGKLLVELVNRTIVRRASPPSTRGGAASAAVPQQGRPHDPWKHQGFKALVMFAGAHWFHGLFRMKPTDRDPNRNVEDCVYGGDYRAHPQAFRSLKGHVNTALEYLVKEPKVSQEILATLHRMVQDCLSKNGKAIHMLSRIMVAPSFARSPTYLRSSCVDVLHSLTNEFIRFNSSKDLMGKLHKSANPEERGIFRTRHVFIRNDAITKEDLGAGGGGGGGGGGGAGQKQIQGQQQQTILSLSPPQPTVSFPDCIEDMLTLQAQIVRAKPSLACNFWCLRGSSASPYQPEYLLPNDARDEDEALMDRATGMYMCDDGCAAGARSNVSGDGLDATGYIRYVANILAHDMERTARRARKAAAATKALASRAAASAAAAAAAAYGTQLLGFGSNKTNSTTSSSLSNLLGIGAPLNQYGAGGGSGENDEFLLEDDASSSLYAPQEAMDMSAETEMHFLSHAVGRRPDAAAALALAKAGGAGGAGGIGGNSIAVMALRNDPRFAAYLGLPSSRGFLALYADFLAAIGAGPLCADGRTCAEALCTFVGGPDFSLDANQPDDVKSSFYLPTTQPGGAGNNGNIVSTKRRRAKHAEELPHCLRFDGLLNTVAIAATELDTEEQNRRGRKFDAELAAWKQEDESRKNDVLLKVLGVDPLGDKPVPPEIRRPCFKVLLSTIRMLQTLCLDADVRDDVCESQFPLPARAMPEEFVVNANIKSGADRTRYIALMDLAGLPSGSTAAGGFSSSSNRKLTDLLETSFHLLRLGVGVRIKSAVFVLLTRISEGSLLYATKVRDAMESNQILRTVSPSLLGVYGGGGGAGGGGGGGMFDIQARQRASGGGGVGAGGGRLPPDIREELKHVETLDQHYDASLAFCDLLRVLVATVEMHTLGRGQRAPGILPHVSFLVKEMLLSYLRRPIRPTHPADRWKLAFGPLSVLFEILRSYRVSYPPPQDALDAAAAAVKSQKQFKPAHGFVEVVQPLPPSARYKAPKYADSNVLSDSSAAKSSMDSSAADATGDVSKDITTFVADSKWFLYAIEWETQPGCSFKEIRDKLQSLLGSLQDQPRLASLSEISTFLGRNPTGGKFRAWTSDGHLSLYDADARQRGDRISPATGGTANKVWFLKRGVLDDESAKASGVRVLVEQPLNLTADLAKHAAGYVPGDPWFDFVPEIPDIRIQLEDGSIYYEEKIRSAGFTIMQDLISGEPSVPLLQIVINILTQAGGIEGAQGAGRGIGRGVASLEEAVEKQDEASVQSIAARALAIERELEAATAKDESVFASIAPFDMSGAKPGADVSAYKQQLALVAEHSAEEAVAGEILAGMRGVPPLCENLPEWREKLLCLALSFMDSALSRDQVFKMGVAALSVSGTFHPIPHLLKIHSALPYIMRAVGYNADKRIGLIASRIMYRIAALRIDDISPYELVQTLTDAEIRKAVPDLSPQQLVAATADCLIIQGGESWRMDLREAIDREKQMMEEEVLRVERRTDANGVYRPIISRSSIENEMLMGAAGGVASTALSGGIAGTILVNRAIATARTAAADAAANEDDDGAGDAAGGGAQAQARLQEDLIENVAAIRSSHAKFALRRDAAEIKFADVALPISRLDGVFGIRAIQGWAQENSANFEAGIRIAHDVRRGIILEMIQRSIDSVEHVRPPTISLGHLLLGAEPDQKTTRITNGRAEAIHGFNMHFFVSPSTYLKPLSPTIAAPFAVPGGGGGVISLRNGPGVPVSDGAAKTCLYFICQAISDLHRVMNDTPLVSELNAAVIVSALRDQRLAKELEKYLDIFLHEKGYWDSVHHTRHFENPSSRRFLALVLAALPTSLVQTSPERLLEELYGPSADNVLQGDDDGGGGVGDDNGGAMVESAQDRSLRLALLADIYKRGYVSVTERQQIAHRNTLAHMMEAVATELHFFATSHPRADIALTATALPVLEPGLGAKHFMRRALDSLHLKHTVAGETPMLISHLPAILDAFAGNRSMASVINDHRSRIIPPMNESTLVPLGLAVNVGGASLQTYNIDVLRHVLAEYQDRVQSSLLSSGAGGGGIIDFTASNLGGASSNFGMGGRRNALDASMLQALGMRNSVIGAGGGMGNVVGNNSDTAFEAGLQDEINLALDWAVSRNSQVLALKAAYGQCASFAQLASIVLHHTLPDVSVNTPLASATRDKQDVWLTKLFDELLGPAVSTLELCAPFTAGEGLRVDSIVLVPIAEYILAIIQRMRSTCPSVRLSRNYMRVLIRKLCTALVARKPGAADAGDAEADTLSAVRLRGLLYSCLLQLAQYAFGAQVQYSFSADTGARASTSPRLVSNSVPLLDQARDECCLGWIEAMQLVGTSAIHVAASDACGSAARWRPLAFLFISSLLRAPTSVSMTSKSGAPYLAALSSVSSSMGGSLTPPVSIAQHIATLQETMLHDLHSSGELRGLITSLVALDAADSSKPDAAAARMLTRPKGYDVEVAFTVARRHKLLRMVWSDDDNNNINGGDKGKNRATSSSVDDEDDEYTSNTSLDSVDAIHLGFGYDYAIQALLAASQAHDDGPRVLVESGLLPAIGRLAWLQRCGKFLVDLRAQSLGLQGSNIDNIIATELSDRVPRLLALLQLISVVLRAHPHDCSLAADIFSWLQRHFVLLDLAVQGSLASRTNIPCIKLMTAFVDLLRGIAAIPGAMDTAVQASDDRAEEEDDSSNDGAGGRKRKVGSGTRKIKSPLDAARADEIVMRLFQRFALQPRAAKRTTKTGAAAIVAVSTSSGPRSWVDNVLPSSLIEEKWAATTFPDKCLLTVEGVVTNAFHVHALTAGEHLCWSLAQYCRVRTAAALPHLMGRAYPTHANIMSSSSSRHGTSNLAMSDPVILFRAPDQVAADSMRVSASPPIRSLLQAIDQAAEAYVHSKKLGFDATKAQVAANAAAAALIAAGPAAVATGAAAAGATKPSTIPLLTDPVCMRRIGGDSARSTLGTFENLLVVWLAHAVADPTLRLADAEDVRRFASKPAIKEACSDSHIAPTVFDRLEDVTRLLGKEASSTLHEHKSLTSIVGGTIVSRAGPASAAAQPGAGRAFGYL